MDSFASFASGLTAQASAAHHQSVAATAAASAVSIGAVGIQDKFKAELQDRFELNCRHFRNPSRTHTVTFYFYQIRRLHTVEFAIEAIELPPVDRLMYHLAASPGRRRSVHPPRRRRRHGGEEQLRR